MRKDVIPDEIKSIAESFRRFSPVSKNKSGKPPGTIHYTGRRKGEAITIDLIDYTKSRLVEKSIKKLEELKGYNKKNTVTWININGVHDTSIIEWIGREYNLHPLILEDIANISQRPKIEDYQDNLFLVLKMISFDTKRKSIDSEQVSIVLGRNLVISFQEKKGDVFDNIRKRLRDKRRIREFGCDYLAYSIVDSIVDEYFSVLEMIGEQISELEQEIISNPKPTTQGEIYRLKREMIYLRRSVWPLRDVLSNIQKGESKLIRKETLVFMRDIHDHIIRIADIIETFRDMMSGMLESYLSSVSNRMNEIMKVLTIISTIFIPLTFIAGVYGMNFVYMPEYNLKWFYPVLWGFMIFVVLFMVSLFKKKKWM